MFARSGTERTDLAVAQILGEQHRVGGGECDCGCLELVQRGDAAVDRGLLDERAHRVVDQQFRAGRDASCPQRLQSRRSAVGAFGAAVDDHAHLRVAGLIDQAFHFIAHLRVDDDDGVGDMRVLLERSMDQQTIGLSSTLTSCLGLSGSKRVPKPAANTTATTGASGSLSSL